jgi:hypothetical protein
LTVTIIDVDLDGVQVARVYVACTDTAIDFADWLTRRGYRVAMRDGVPAEHPRTPREAQAADALAEMFARSLATSAGA